MTTTYSDNGTSTNELARAVLRGMTMQPSLTLAAAPKAQEPSFGAVAAGLDALVKSEPALQSALEELLARTLRQVLASTPGAVPAMDSILSMFKDGQIGTKSKGGTVARAFWWGFHIEISHEDLDVFLAVGSTVNTIVGAIGGGIPSPAQPFIVIAAEFVKGALGLLKSLDRGRGVYISMSWFAPGVFVPTSV
jgi:hypothetical protein